MSGPGRAIPHTTSRAAVLDVIRAAGTISRVGLADATGFTGATISTVVRKLIDDGLVMETGRTESTGGKPRVLLRLDHTSRYAIGVHIDPVGITYALTDLTGAVVSRMTRAGAGEENPAVIVGRAATQIGILVDGAGVDRERVLGIGLVTAASGSHPHQPTMRHWADFPAETELARVTGLPVVTGNDATAAALGEYWAGSTDGSSVFAAVSIGTHLGAGLVVNGLPYHGAGGFAGQIGHVCLDLEGPVCWCGARGCAEAIAGPGAVVDAARADTALARTAGLDGEHPSVAAEFTAVVRAARRGEARAIALLDDSARHLAVAVRSMANIVDLDLLVLTGPGSAAAGPFYLPAIQQELDRAFFARADHPVRVRLSTFASTAPAIGAATMVLQTELVPMRPGHRLPEGIGQETGELRPRDPEFQGGPGASQRGG